jgi:hypothetical protein
MKLTIQGGRRLTGCSHGPQTWRWWQWIKFSLVPCWPVKCGNAALNLWVYTRWGAWCWELYLEGPQSLGRETLLANLGEIDHGDLLVMKSGDMRMSRDGMLQLSKTLERLAGKKVMLLVIGPGDVLERMPVWQAQAMLKEIIKRGGEHVAKSLEMAEGRVVPDVGR